MVLEITPQAPITGYIQSKSQSDYWDYIDGLMPYQMYKSCAGHQDSSLSPNEEE